ncbi:hypothetical protein [Streptomyces sp. AC550_RSS872]|uniref:hypothetical protein n=1 Tax=Streptomyces sp. AC550_RSS872 TaxID=2823689 RepID=UPI001C268678|nr:hypothetical protein [Streptomyces sp. AC550_RSS872]
MAAATVTVAATAGIPVHRLTAADPFSTARAELDGQLVSAAYDYASAAVLRPGPGRRPGRPEPWVPWAPPPRRCPRDEITRLAASMNTTADALGARPEDERRVSADIAHELRTPSAGLGKTEVRIVRDTVVTTDRRSATVRPPRVPEPAWARPSWWARPRLPGAESVFRNRPQGGAEAVLSLPASVAG